MKIRLFLSLIICFISIFGQAVNGELVIEDNYKLLKVWGTHQERGLAQGFLLGEEIKALGEDYFLGYVFQNNVYYYNYVRNNFEQNFLIDEQYIEEAQGIIQGMELAEIDLYNNILNREMDHVDLLISSSITDISVLNILNGKLRLGCSSMSSWAQSTENDPDLNGEIVITRNMDWTSHQLLLDNHLLLVHFPTEENEIPWISFTFPGFLGTLSGMNIEQLAAFKNVGNINSHPNPGPFHPILLTIRNAVESFDYNADGSSDNNDVLSAITDKERLAGSLIHCVSVNEAMIIECNNQNGIVIRTLEDNITSPNINGTNLVVTNHFRKLYPPIYCNRYENFADSLTVNSDITIQRSWDIASAAGGSSGNIHKIQYIPSRNKIVWAMAETGSPAYQCDAHDFEIDELFTLNVSSPYHEINNTFIKINSYPNPVNQKINISFNLPYNDSISLEIFNIKGQKIKNLVDNSYKTAGKYNYCWNIKDNNEKKIANGVYLYRLQTRKHKMINKFIIIK